MAPPQSRRFLWSLAFAASCALPLAAAHAQAPGRATRTAIDTERGGYFTYPYGNQWSRFGAEFARTNYSFTAMPALAFKGLHGRLQHFAAVDDPPEGYAYFPWTEFLAYDADEVAQGRPSMVMTATYQGRKRPLYFSYGAFTPAYPFQGLHVRDERFIKFWIKNYVRNVLSSSYVQGWWVGADNSTYRYDLYGVLDDGGNYIKNLPWDAPYPQNDAEWVSAIVTMLTRIKEWAPNIRIACNDIGLNEGQAHRHAEIVQQIDGVIREDFWYLAGGTSDWYRNAFYNSISRDIYRASVGKVEVLEIPMSASDTTLLRRSFVAFLLVGGDNLFFGPKDSSARELNPALWADMRNRLGRPIGVAQSVQEPGLTTGQRLYWRECEGGIVYLNWIGANKTVTLPTGTTYYNRSGAQVTSITLGDLSGDYVLTSPNARVSWPAIHPRHAGPVTGPLTVTLDIDPAFATGATIRYTTDGSDPTAASPTYTAPFALSNSATVKTRAFKAGLLDSFVNAANYSVLATPPAVEFHLAGDHGSEFLAHEFPLVKLSNVSNASVQVSYSVTGGTATNGSDYTLAAGTLNFPPGEQHRFFKLPIANDALDEANETVVITLSSPVNATLGARTIYTYTIDDNDGSANQAPVVTFSPASGATVTSPASLTATVSDDDLPIPGNPVTTAWSKLSGPGTVTFSAPTSAATSAAFSLPGAYVLRFAADDGAIVSTADLALTVRETFGAWAARYGISGATADTDLDGVAHLLEYVLVGDPTNPQSSPAPLCRKTLNRLALSFVHDSSLTDVTLGVWGADHPAGPWTTLASSTAGAPFTVVLGGATVSESYAGALRTVEVRDAFNFGEPAHPRRFLQLRVSQ